MSMSDHLRSSASDNSASVRRRAKDGDRSAIGRLLAQQAEPLRRWAHRRLPAWARSISDTTDLVQDAIVRTLGRFGAIDVEERGALGAYLRQAVNNRIADEFRRVGRRGVAVPVSDDLACVRPSPFDEAAAIELEGRYKCALECLRPAERQLIVGQVELGYSPEQLACMTGRSLGATRMALRRALVRLANELSRQRG